MFAYVLLTFSKDGLVKNTEFPAGVTAPVADRQA